MFSRTLASSVCTANPYFTDLSVILLLLLCSSWTDQVYNNLYQAFRPLFRQPQALQPRFAGIQLRSNLYARYLSSETRTAIDKAVASAPVVLFMKGTPETPQCGFSRASIQILGLQGVDPKKFVAFNVLEDSELRQGMLYKWALCPWSLSQVN